MNLQGQERRGGPEVPPRLVVTNLPYEVTEQELMAIFSDCGYVKVTLKK
jgi:hypothetical protein